MTEPLTMAKAANDNQSIMVMIMLHMAAVAAVAAAAKRKEKQQLNKRCCWPGACTRVASCKLHVARMLPAYKLQCHRAANFTLTLLANTRSQTANSKQQTQTARLSTHTPRIRNV